MIKKIKILIFILVSLLIFIKCEDKSNNYDRVYSLGHTDGKIRITGLSEYNGKYAIVIIPGNIQGSDTHFNTFENKAYLQLVGVDGNSISTENGTHIYNGKQIENGEVIILLYGLRYSYSYYENHVYVSGIYYGSYNGSDTLDIFLFISDTISRNEDSIKITIPQVPFLDGKATVSLQ